VVGVALPLVLVVDDYDDTREMCAELLSLSGFRVAEAKSGEEALEKAFELVPDVILMDVSLPGMDGTIATRHLKADKRTAEIPVIALTGHVKAKRGGFDAVVVKPCMPDELVAHLRRLIEKTRQR
jgi:CheY-like chemotaxis protein